MKRDLSDKAAIKRVHDARRSRYGARKVWHVLRREGYDIARCTVERLMRTMGLQGVVRGNCTGEVYGATVRGQKVIATNPDAAQPCPDDKANRAFVAERPNQLWVSDFTYVSSWQGMVYVAPRHCYSDQWRSNGSMIVVFARKIAGWRVSTLMTNEPKPTTPGEPQKKKPRARSCAASSDVSCAKSTGTFARRATSRTALDKHSSINALAESIIGLFKTEAINFPGPWKSVGRVEWETLKWLDWYNTERPHSAIGYVTPQEAGAAFHENLNADDQAA